MDFPGILKVVKIQNPELSHKDAQKKASDMLKKFKAAQTEPPVILPRTSAAAPLSAGTIPTDLLLDVEARIRSIGVDINSIIRNGREIMPEGEIVKHGNSGVNTLVTLEDGKGNRLPVEGCFIVWI